MYVTMITFLCPFLLESPILNLKIATKTWDTCILKATYLNSLLHISNEKQRILFEISKYVKYF